jgi:hypothetical protein
VVFGSSHIKGLEEGRDSLVGGEEQGPSENKELASHARLWAFQTKSAQPVLCFQGEELLWSIVCVAWTVKDVLCGVV